MMTDDAQSEETARSEALLRLMTLVVGSVEVICFVLLAHLLLHSTDPLGASTGEGVMLLLTVPLVGLTLPGLLLAWLNRAPRLALGLVVAAAPLAVLLWAAA